MKKLGSYFETKTRDSGESFVTTTDDRPEWLHDAIYEAHGGDAPDDWIYAECEAACDAIDDEYLTDEDSIHEYADGRVDVYTKALFAWAHEKCLSSTWSESESEAEDCGGEDTDMTKRIMQLQYFAIARIARTMLAAWEEHQDDDEESDDAEESVSP